MLYRVGLCCLALFLAGLPGCGPNEPAGMKRDPVFKVTGKLLINGKPEERVRVNLVRTSEADPSATTSKSLPSDALTDKDGNFAIGTYEKEVGDGAPNGEYAITFQWGSINLIGRQYAGDKLGGKFNDPKTSEHKVKVEGKPVDLGTIELTATITEPSTQGMPKGGLGAGAEERNQRRNRRP